MRLLRRFFAGHEVEDRCAYRRALIPGLLYVEIDYIDLIIREKLRVRFLWRS